jgi:glycosyltransferase involved in cell wall biosynthesis
MDRLRIAMIAPEFLPNWGGVGTYCIELAKKICDKADLHIITVNRTIKGQKRTYTSQEMSDYFGGKLQVHAISDAKNTFLYNAQFQYAFSKFMPRFAMKNGIDLIHNQHAHMSDILYKFTSNRRVESLTTLHTTIDGQKRAIEMSDMRTKDLEPSEKWQMVLHAGLRMAENFSLRRCQNYITVSDWMRRQVKDDFPFIKRMDVVYNGTDPDVYKPISKEKSVFKGIDEPIVLFTSRMTAVKGANYLIDAIPQILKETKDVHFAFVGAGDNKPWIELLGKRGVDKKHFSFHGYLDYSILPSMYSEAYCYMLPTLYENFPIRMLEAMSCGVPVIGSDICGIPEAVQSGRNGILVPPKDSAGIARATLELLGDRDKAQDMGRNARDDIINKFTWGVCADRTLECYGRALEGRRR